MTSASIICAKKDTRSVLEALNGFGEFHIEHAAEDVTYAEQIMSSQKIEESLVHVNELTEHLIKGKTGFFDIFKIIRQTKTQVTAENWQALSIFTSQQVLALKREFDELNASLSSLQERTALLCNLKDMLETMDKMGADLAAIEELKLIHVVIAGIPHKNFALLEPALNGLPLILHRCYLSKEDDFLCAAMPDKIRTDVEWTLKTYYARIFEIPEDLPHNVGEALAEVNSRLEENSIEEKTILTSIEKLGKENRNNLASWKEITENTIALLNAENKILQTERLSTVKGFVPKKKFHIFKEKVHSMLEGKVLILENEVAAIEDPPTKFSHGRFVRPFEEITKLYGVPHYDEFDPTAVIALTFPLIFGLMFGDFGHGLILLVGGLTIGKLIKNNTTIKNVCWILAACGAGAIFAGLLFGEFFGMQVFAPLWFSPFDNVLIFLIFSLFVGATQIVSGLVLEMVNFLLKRDISDALLTSAPKIAFYVGAVYLISVYQLDLGEWFTGPVLLVLLPFVFLVFGKPAFFALERFAGRCTRIQSEQSSVGERFFEGGDLVTRLLSNTMSYARILALLMAHWALILAIYVVAGLVGSASLLAMILSGVIIAVGNLFVIALEGLIVFIHTLRLHFYEWFSKFYQGTGMEFKPFRQSFVYTDVVLEQKQNSKK